MELHRRYFCATCKIEFVDGGWILKNNQQARWTVEDGCPRCRSSVSRIEYTPPAPGLDVPRDDRTGLALALLEHVGTADEVCESAVVSGVPVPLRQNDHHGTNDILTPRPAPEPPTCPDLWQMI